MEKDESRTDVSSSLSNLSLKDGPVDLSRWAVNSLSNRVLKEELAYLPTPEQKALALKDEFTKEMNSWDLIMCLTVMESSGIIDEKASKEAGYKIDNYLVQRGMPAIVNAIKASVLSSTQPAISMKVVMQLQKMSASKVCDPEDFARLKTHCIVTASRPSQVPPATVRESTEVLHKDLRSIWLNFEEIFDDMNLYAEHLAAVRSDKDHVVGKLKEIWESLKAHYTSGGIETKLEAIEKARNALGSFGSKVGLTGAFSALTEELRDLKYVLESEKHFFDP
jgi:hypothetical protein